MKKSGQLFDDALNFASSYLWHSPLFSAIVFPPLFRDKVLQY